MSPCRKGDCKFSSIKESFVEHFPKLPQTDVSLSVQQRPSARFKDFADLDLEPLLGKRSFTQICAWSGVHNCLLFFKSQNSCPLVVWNFFTQNRTSSGVTTNAVPELDEVLRRRPDGDQANEVGTCDAKNSCWINGLTHFLARISRIPANPRLALLKSPSTQKTGVLE
jgi:hypothetical protein